MYLDREIVYWQILFFMLVNACYVMGQLTMSQLTNMDDYGFKLILYLEVWWQVLYEIEDTD